MMNIKTPYTIINKYKIELFVVFGSYADNTVNENSDLDLGFLTNSLLIKQEAEKLLRELIQFYSKTDIDLVDLKKATPQLKQEIARNSKVLYQKDNKFFDFQLYAARIYADTKYLRENRKKTLADKLNNL